MNESRLMTFVQIFFITALLSSLVFCSKRADTEKALQEANVKITQLTNEANRLKAEKETGRRELEKTLQEANTKITQLTDEANRLKAEKETGRRKLEKTLQEANVKITQLTNEANRLKAEKETGRRELEAKLSETNKSLDHANTQLAQLQTKQKDETAGYQQRLTAQNDTIAELNKRLTVLMEAQAVESRQSAQRIGNLERQITQHKQAFEKAQTQLAELEQTKEDLTAQLHLTTASLVKFKTAHADELKKSNTLENIVQEREKKLNAADARVQHLEASQKKLSDRLHQIESVIQALTLDKDTALSRIQELQQAVAGSGETLAQMSANLSRSEKERNLAQSAIIRLKSTYAQLVKEFESEIKNKEATISGLKEKLSITFMDDILYDLSEVSVNPKKAKQALEKIGQVLRRNPNNKIVVAGHTDNMPIKMAARDRFPSNWELSAARAAAVVRYFQNQLGIDPARMEIAGHAYYKPVANNDTPQNRSKNRRVEIFIMPLR